MKFHISDSELVQRKRRILFGLLFSLLLAALIAYQHLYYPEEYNDVLLWSVIGFVILANLVNYYRHRKYLRRAAVHHIEVLDGLLRFTTGDEVSELSLEEVAALRLFQTAGRLGHIQLRLNNGRGIRLEGYEAMDALAEALKKQLPHKELT
jgi:hypothetical protein